MSLEAWGDDGNPPTHWEETALHQNLAAVQWKLYEFFRAYEKDFPNDEFREAFDRADEAIQDMFGQIEGEI